MAGGAETPNIAALPAIARLGACESARGPDADRHVKLLIQFAVEGSLSGAYSHLSRGELRDHMNYRKNDCWLSYRFYRALQRLKSPMRNFCEIFGARDFRFFQHNRCEADI